MPSVLSLLVPLLVAFAGIGIYLYPSVTYTLSLLHTTLHPSDLPKIVAFNATCTPAHTTTLIGCEDLHLVGSSIYTACESSRLLQNRLKWGRDKTDPSIDLSFAGDKLYRWDLVRDEVVELELRGMPEEEVVDGKVTAAERSFLGLDVNERSDGTVTIYVINLRRKRNAVDKFHHDPKTGYATFVRRFEMEHPDSAWVPDDVFAIPEYDDEDAFYVTCDHGSKGEFMQKMEYALRRPWSWVSFYSTRTGWKRALTGIIGANGIIGHKSPIDRRIFIAEVAAGTIKATRMLTSPPERFGDLELLDTITLGKTGDNPTLSLDGSEVWITGAAQAQHLKPYLTAPEPEFEDRGKSAVGEWKGPGSFLMRFPARGKVAGVGEDGGVQMLMTDRDGRFANFSTTALVVPRWRKEERRGRELLVTGLKFEGVMRCEIFGA